MGFNGTGTFERIYNWVTDNANGINIEAPRMDAEDDGFATGLSNCITKDGQTTITANIPFNSKKITGLANGSARTDSIALGQVQDNTYRYLGENGGVADAYTWSPSPSIEAYTAGQSWLVKIGSGDDNTGASTANISALGTRTIDKSDGAGSTTALEAGDMVAGGIYELFDNGSTITLLNPQKPYLDLANATNATTTTQGISYLNKPVTIANNATDADHDMDFGAANFDFDDGSGQATLSALTKQFDNTFALGTNAGGMVSGESLPTSGYVYLYAISNSAGTTTDIIGTTTADGSTISGDSVVSTNSLTKKQYIGSLLTDASANIDQSFVNVRTSFGQVAKFTTGAYSSGASIIPFDDSIPQNTEGTEFMTATFKPISATSKLLIDISINLGAGSATIYIAALFQDSTVDALATGVEYAASAPIIKTINFSKLITSSSTSTTTFNVRASATAGTVQFNGVPSARRFGGSLTSSITITEILA